MTLLSFKTFTP